MENQISIFDILASSPEPEAPAHAPKPAALDLSVPRPYAFQASFSEDGKSFHVLGVARAVTTPDALRLDPVPLLSLTMTDYYLRHEYIPRAQMIDVYFHEIDGAGNTIRDKADAHITIQADALYAIAEHAA